MPDALIVYTDGAARGNPGPAGIGVVIKAPDGKTLRQIAQAIGRRTNNQAEYEAVIAGLRAAAALRAQQLTLRLDSELVARQLRGEYKVKSSDLILLYNRARALMSKFSRMRIEHVPRSRNAAADRLANRGIDGSMNI